MCRQRFLEMRHLQRFDHGSDKCVPMHGVPMVHRGVIPLHVAPMFRRHPTGGIPRNQRRPYRVHKECHQLQA